MLLDNRTSSTRRSERSHDPAALVEVGAVEPDDGEAMGVALATGRGGFQLHAGKCPRLRDVGPVDERVVLLDPFAPLTSYYHGRRVALDPSPAKRSSNGAHVPADELLAHGHAEPDRDLGGSSP